MDNGLQIALNIVEKLTKEYDAYPSYFVDERQVLIEITRRIRAVIAGEAWPYDLPTPQPPSPSPTHDTDLRYVRRPIEAPDPEHPSKQFDWYPIEDKDDGC